MSVINKIKNKNILEVIDTKVKIISKIEIGFCTRELVYVRIYFVDGSFADTNIRIGDFYELLLTKPTYFPVEINEVIE